MFKNIKAVFSLVLFLSLGCAHIPTFAEVTVWHTANPITIAWDPVATNVNREAVTVTIEYEVGTADIDRSNLKRIWRGTETSATIPLSEEGEFILWVKACLMVDGKKIVESVYAWSNDPAAVKNGKTFGVISTSR